MRKTLYFVLCATLGATYAYGQNILTSNRLCSEDNMASDNKKYRSNPYMKYKIDSLIAETYIVQSGDSLKLDLTKEKALELKITEDNYNKLLSIITERNANGGGI